MATAGPSVDVLGLTFSPTHRFRPRSLVAPGFVAVDQQPPDRADGLVRAASGPVAPFAAVEVSVDAAGAGGAGGAGDSGGPGRVELGLATGEDEHVLATWSARGSRVAISVRRGGRTRLLRRRKVALGASFRLAFVLCENQVSVLVDAGAGWRPVLTERAKVAALVDLRREDVMAAHRYAWGATGVRLAGVRAGLFGAAGLRDPHLVQHADGTAYERDGRLFLTWTCAGLGNFAQAHWSVWSLDPADPAGMRLEAQLFTRRDGLVLGDHAGQLVRDGDRWLVATSSWGDFAPGRIHVRHATTTADLLSGVHLLETERTPLPTEHGSWDPALTRVGGRWHVAYVESRSQRPFTFHPVLASTAADDWTEDLAVDASLGGMRQCEGPVLVTAAGRTRLLASDGEHRRYPAYELDGTPAGRLDAPYGSNIPHPQLVPDPAGGWLLVTFDGTAPYADVLGYGGHGDVLVLHSD